MSQDNPRWAEFNMITGAPGTGKSTLCDKAVAAAPEKNALILLKEVDLLRSSRKGEAFSRYPYLDDIYRYAGGKVKLNAEDIDIAEFMRIVAASYRNGIIVIDEAGMYDLCHKNPNNQRVEPIPAFKEVLKQRRKYNITTYLLYHEVSEMPVQLMGWVNNFILFHQTAEFRNKSSVPRFYEIEAMRNRIQEKYFAGNRHYSEVLKLA